MTSADSLESLVSVADIVLLEDSFKKRRLFPIKEAITAYFFNTINTIHSIKTMQNKMYWWKLLSARYKDYRVSFSFIKKRYIFISLYIVIILFFGIIPKKTDYTVEIIMICLEYRQLQLWWLLHFFFKYQSPQQKNVM